MSIWSKIVSGVSNVANTVAGGAAGLVQKAVGGAGNFLGNVIGVNPLDVVNAYTGVSGVEAQRDAIAAGMQNVADTNAANLAATRETNALNYQLWQEQRQLQRDFFDEANVYNSAAAQKQRLLDADLNPALAMYGGAGSATAHTPNPTNAPQMVAPHLQAYIPPAVDYSGMQNSVNMLAGIVKSVAEIDKLHSETAKTTADTALSRVQYHLVEQQCTDMVYKNGINQWLAGTSYTPEAKAAAAQAIVNEWMYKATKFAMQNKNVPFEEKQIQSAANKLFHESVSAEYDAAESKSTKEIFQLIDEKSGDFGAFLGPLLNIMLRYFSRR